MPVYGVCVMNTFTAFGVIGEKQVRIMTHDLCQSLLGDDHPSKLIVNSCVKDGLCLFVN